MKTLKELYQEFKEEQKPLTPEQQQIIDLQRQLLQEKYISRQKDKKLKSYQNKPLSSKYKKYKKHNKKHKSINKVAVTPPNPSKILAPIQKKSSYRRVTGAPVKETLDVLESEELIDYGIKPSTQPFAVAKFIDGRFNKLIKYFPDEDSAFQFIGKA